MTQPTKGRRSSVSNKLRKFVGKKPAQTDDPGSLSTVVASASLSLRKSIRKIKKSSDSRPLLDTSENSTAKPAPPPPRNKKSTKLPSLRWNNSFRLNDDESMTSSFRSTQKYPSMRRPLEDTTEEMTEESGTDRSRPLTTAVARKEADLAMIGSASVDVDEDKLLGPSGDETSKASLSAQNEEHDTSIAGTANIECTASDIEVSTTASSIQLERSYTYPNNEAITEGTKAAHGKKANSGKLEKLMKRAKPSGKSTPSVASKVSGRSKSSARKLKSSSSKAPSRAETAAQNSTKSKVKKISGSTIPKEESSTCTPIPSKPVKEREKATEAGSQATPRPAGPRKSGRVRDRAARSERNIHRERNTRIERAAQSEKNITQGNSPRRSNRSTVGQTIKSEPERNATRNSPRRSSRPKLDKETVVRGEQSTGQSTGQSTEPTSPKKSSRLKGEKEKVTETPRKVRRHTLEKEIDIASGGNPDRPRRRKSQLQKAHRSEELTATSQKSKMKSSRRSSMKSTASRTERTENDTGSKRPANNAKSEISPESVSSSRKLSINPDISSDMSRKAIRSASSLRRKSVGRERKDTTKTPTARPRRKSDLRSVASARSARKSVTSGSELGSICSSSSSRFSDATPRSTLKKKQSLLSSRATIESESSKSFHDDCFSPEVVVNAVVSNILDEVPGPPVADADGSDDGHPDWMFKVTEEHFSKRGVFNVTPSLSELVRSNT